MSNSQDSLSAKVKAVNRANEHANKLYAELAEVFRPFVGQSILKADGELLTKVAKLLPKSLNYNRVNPSPNLHVYPYRSKYSLVWMVKTSESNGQWSIYRESSVYVGTLVGTVLASIYDPPSYRTDYTVEEAEKKRQEYREAKKLADTAQSALSPFGEYDR